MSTILLAARAALLGTTSFESAEFVETEISDTEIAVARDVQAEIAEELTEAKAALVEDTAEASMVLRDATVAQEQLESMDQMDSREATAAAGFANITLNRVADSIGVPAVTVQVDEVGDVSTESALDWIKSVIKALRDSIALKWRGVKRSFSLLSNFEANGYARLSKIKAQQSRRKGNGGKELKLSDAVRTSFIDKDRLTEDPVKDLLRDVEATSDIVSVVIGEINSGKDSLAKSITEALISKNTPDIKLFGDSFDKKLIGAINKHGTDEMITLLGSKVIFAKKLSKGAHFGSHKAYNPKNLLRAVQPLVSYSDDEIEKISNGLRNSVIPKLVKVHKEAWDGTSEFEDLVSGMLDMVSIPTDTTELVFEPRSRTRMREMLYEVIEVCYEASDNLAELTIHNARVLHDIITVLEESVFQD